MIVKATSRAILIITLLIAFNSVAFGQKKYYSKSKKAVKHFESALSKYTLKYFTQAKQDLSKAIAADKNFLDAYSDLGGTHFGSKSGQFPCVQTIDHALAKLPKAGAAASDVTFFLD